MRAPHSRERGAALLLLLMLLGLGVATIFLQGAGRDLLDLPRQQRSQQLVQQAQEALIGFAATHGRLPRPAISGTDGRENPQPCSSAASCTGLLPWVTLGIEGADAWAKRLHYSVTPVFAEWPLHRTDAVADKEVLGRMANGQLYYAHGSAQCSVQRPCAAAVIFSSGRRNLGISVDGIVQANNDSGNVDELKNIGSTNQFITRPLNADARQPGGEFDDIVTWVPVKKLYAVMATTGSLD
jgi:hypothetical protein